MSCPHAKMCPLYPQFKMKSLLRFWVVNYCEADHERCARFQLASAGEPVPVTLLPSGRLLEPARDPER
jgi:hypothetical protein